MAAIYNQPARLGETIARYLGDAMFRSQLDAERDERRARFNAAMAAHDAREAARREARWALENQQGDNA